MSSIRVVQLGEPGQPLSVAEAPKPTPAAYEVLVKVSMCGLVPNAPHIASRKSPFIVPVAPASFGLDVSGVIKAVGAKVFGINVGDRVYVDPLITCETCHHCRRGRRELCERSILRGYFAMSAAGKPLLDAYPYGGLSEYIVSPHDHVAKLPDNVDFPTAARFGYMCTSFAAFRKGGLRPGDTLLINGVTGTLGVAAVAIALGMGVSRILGVGRNPDLLERVRQMDPNRVAVTSPTEVDVAHWTKNFTHGLGVDLVYDCLGVGGASSTTNTMMKALKRGGKAMLTAGGVSGEICRSYLNFVIDDIHARGSNWFDNKDLDLMIGMISSGAIDTSYLDHRIFSLADVNEAFDLVGSRPGGFVNVVVSPEL